MQNTLLRDSEATNPPSGAARAVKLDALGLVLVSGAVAWDAKGRVDGIGNFRKQANRSFENLRGVLESLDSSLEDVVKFTFYLTNIAQRLEMVEIRRAVMGSHRPPSTTVVVEALVESDLLVEIDAIALIGASGTFVEREVNAQ